jgi:Na+/H+-dicarboxylate symporter
MRIGFGAIIGMGAYIGTVVLGLVILLIFFALIIGVDRILDISRTTINVTGDLTACTIMNHWLKPNR